MSNDRISYGAWSIRYHYYHAADEGRREALFALGNGYLLTRAAAPENSEDGVHYPGTYRVGCYNRLNTPVAGREVEIESLVNLPNWLPLSFRIAGEGWFSLQEVDILSYQQELHLDKAYVERTIRFCTKEGRRCSLYEKRFVSMAQEHLMLLRQEIKAENWQGTIEVRSGLNGDVQNNNVARYTPFRKKHLQTLSVSPVGSECLELVAQTVQSKIIIALQARTRLMLQGRPTSCSRSIQAEDNSITEYQQANLQEGETLIVEKVAALYTSGDLAIADCQEAARLVLEAAQEFDALFEAHCSAWQELWQHCRLDMMPAEQLPFFRLHMFHILQNISRHTADLDVGVAPSGWQGEEYFGHIFWDEMFIFPFLSFRFPTIARSLLLYRYRRLDAARSLAKERGCKGAMFPWRSASSGREETPLLQYNLYSGHWMEDYTYLQHHIGSIIAYSICNYVEVTGDKLFLAEYGAEMLLEIARFWASFAVFNPQLKRYEIKGVVGPDEHHTHYPGANTDNPLERGIHNNTYTNVLAAWTLMRAGQLYQQLSQQQQQALQQVTGIDSAEVAQWEEISKNIHLVFLEDGSLDQFEGFSQLKEFKLEAFRSQYGYRRVDWTLEEKGDSIIHYKLSKQADTSLLLYLFTPEELQAILKHMGYQLSAEQLKKTLEREVAHTANESSLSRIIHAGAYSRFNPEASWKFFQEAQLIDLHPEEDRDSSEGIHLGAMGATLGVLQHHYLGIEVQAGVLTLQPALPKEIEKVTIRFLFRGAALAYQLEHGQGCIQSLDATAPSLKVKVNQKTHTLQGGDTLCFSFEA